MLVLPESQEPPMGVDSEKLWGRCSKAIVAAMRLSDVLPALAWAREERFAWDRDEILNCLESTIVSRSTWSTTTARERRFLAAIRSAICEEFDAPASSDRAALVQGALLALRALDAAIYERSVSVGELATRLAIKADLGPERALAVGDAGRLHALGRAPGAGGSSAEASRRARIGLDVLDMHDATRPLKAIIDGMYDAEVWLLTVEMGILRVAEAFVSLCSSTHDRPGLIPERALDTMRAERATRYPEAFLGLLNDVLRVR
jgi:HD-GYP domain-containing protein (c-di-GMP phosphodiesterase class II)